VTRVLLTVNAPQGHLVPLELVLQMPAIFLIIPPPATQLIPARVIQLDGLVMLPPDHVFLLLPKLLLLMALRATLQ
jgi:hypothetical protein